MSDEKTPIEQVLDLFVFAPLGLALTAQENLPQLIDKGRQRVQSQVTMARMVGEFAAKEAQKEAGKRVRQVTDTLGGGRPTAPVATPTPSPASTPNPEPVQAKSNGKSASAAPSPAPAPRPAASAASLAIPNYDALSASQVVQRLAGLAPDELEAVREYEEATRGRRTILAKAAQLQAEPSA